MASASTARRVIAAVIVAAGLGSGCARDDLAPYHPCAQRDEYTRHVAEAQGRYEYVKRRCQQPGCSAAYRALLRVMRREADTFRRLAAQADTLCVRADG